MKKLLIAAGIFFALVSGANAEWDYAVVNDQMTDKPRTVLSVNAIYDDNKGNAADISVHFDLAKKQVSAFVISFDDIRPWCLIEPCDTRIRIGKQVFSVQYSTSDNYIIIMRNGQKDKELIDRMVNALAKSSRVKVEVETISSIDYYESNYYAFEDSMDSKCGTESNELYIVICEQGKGYYLDLQKSGGR